MGKSRSTKSDHQGDKIGAGGGFGVSKAGVEVALETFCHTSDAISLKSEGAIVSIAPKHGCSSFQIQIQKKTLTTTIRFLPCPGFFVAVI